VTDTYEIWVLTDGRAGNIAQAMGLAEAIARTRRTTITAKQITLKRLAAWIPPALSHRLGARTGGWPFSGIARGSDALDYPWPDLIIGAGRRVGPVVAAMGHLYAMPVVQLLNPRMPASAFDAVVAPEHDKLTGENVLVSTGALTRLTPDAVRAAAGPWWHVLEVRRRRCRKSGGCAGGPVHAPWPDDHTLPAHAGRVDRDAAPAAGQGRVHLGRYR